jgi:hypothetical protein
LSRFLLRNTRKPTEGQEDQTIPETKPTLHGIRGRLYDFSPTCRAGLSMCFSWRRARNLNRPHLGFETCCGTAPAGFTTEYAEVYRTLGNVAAHCLSPQIFRDAHSTPSAADSEFSPAVIERAMEGQMKRRGRKFAESDAFFGGLGRGADKFRIFPCAKLSASSVVAPQAELECCPPLKGSFGIPVLFLLRNTRKPTEGQED